MSSMVSFGNVDDEEVGENFMVTVVEQMVELIRGVGGEKVEKEEERGICVYMLIYIYREREGGRRQERSGRVGTHIGKTLHYSSETEQVRCTS